jgi:cytochrome c
MLKQALISSVLMALATVNPASAQQAPPPSAQATKIEALVDKAAALTNKEGKVALAEFRKRDSEWWSGNTYLFAYDMKLNVLLNPAFPQREGTNAHGEKDANGVFFHDEFVKVVQAKGFRLGRLYVPKTRSDPTVAKMELRQDRQRRRYARADRRGVLSTIAADL